MLEFFMDMQPLILDVLCIVILALIVFFGVIRGIKKNLIMSDSLFKKTAVRFIYC